MAFLLMLKDAQFRMSISARSRAARLGRQTSCQRLVATESCCVLTIQRPAFGRSPRSIRSVAPITCHWGGDEVTRSMKGDEFVSLIRSILSDVTRDSFHWRGQNHRDGGKHGIWPRSCSAIE
jgi:hypothetical protein